MKNEIIKLIKKKSFYIVTLVFVLFCILTNIVYKTPMTIYDTDEVNIQDLYDENQSLNLDDAQDLLIYVENLTTIKMEELKDQYPDSTSKYLIDHFLYSTIYQFFESEYILEDNDLANFYSVQLDEEKRHVENQDWQYFLKERIQYLEERNKNTIGVEQLRYSKLLELANYRLDEQVAYDPNNFLHQSLVFLEENTFEYLNLLNDENLTAAEEERLTYLKEEMSIHEYVLDTKQDVLNDHNLRAVLINFPQEFGLFILIYVIMIAGSIVSEEYSRGTIKYLLTKPFKRSTILTSKLLAIIFAIPLIMLFMSIVEIGIGGVILGFDSLSIPMVFYTQNAIETSGVLSYLASLLASSLPMYFLIGIFAFMISTLTLSTSAAITISFLFYLVANVISNLALVYHFPIFKAFLSLYWDFSYLITFDSQPYGASMGLSCVVMLVYLIVMLCITYVTFMKKDVKNI